MITSEQVVEYLIMIDLQRKGAENKLNAEGLSTLFDLQSDKKLKDVKIVDILDYIHTQEEKIEDYKKALRGEMFINFKLPMEHAQFKQQLAEKDKEIERQIAVNKEMDTMIGEKDKEIEKLKDKLKRTEKAMHKEVKEHLEYYNADQKQLRHQVCDEIRDFMNTYDALNPTRLFVMDLLRKLDQIEKGSNNE